MVHHLFVYGTLQHAPLLAALLGRDVALTPATLRDHRAAPLAGRPYPGLVAEPGTSAAGRLVDVDDRELLVLDDFEGPDYTRILVSAVVGDGRSGEVEDAFAYLLTGPGRADVVTGTWDLDRFVRDHAARWVGSADPGAHHPRE